MILTNIKFSEGSNEPADSNCVWGPRTLYELRHGRPKANDSCPDTLLNREGLQVVYQMATQLGRESTGT